MPPGGQELKELESSEHWKLTPDKVSEYLRLAEALVDGFVGSVVMAGVGGTIDQVYEVAELVAEPDMASTLKVWLPPASEE